MKTARTLALFLIGCSSQAQPTIYHVCDSHAIPFELYALDIRDQAKADGVTFTDDELMSMYVEFLAGVLDYQEKLTEEVRKLAESTGVRRVYVEASLDGSMPTIEGLEALPAESVEALLQASPVTPDGKIEFNADTMEKREDAIVRRLLDSGPVVIVILGGGHDLADNIERLSGG